MEQVPFFTEFGEDNFADNPEPRCPCLLLLDVSGSMQGRPLDQLNQGLINIYTMEIIRTQVKPCLQCKHKAGTIAPIV